MPLFSLPHSIWLTWGFVCVPDCLLTWAKQCWPTLLRLRNKLELPISFLCIHYILPQEFSESVFIFLLHSPVSFYCTCPGRKPSIFNHWFGNGTSMDHMFHNIKTCKKLCTRKNISDTANIDYTAGECKAFKCCVTETAEDISDKPSQK